MIFFLTDDNNKYTLELFCDQCRANSQLPVYVIGYSEVKFVNSFREAVVIFCDAERYSGKKKEDLLTMYKAIRSQSPNVILNKPDAVLNRYELCNVLFTNGVNPYRAFQQPFDFRKIRFPIFIRNKYDHRGALTNLILNHEDALKSITNLLRSNKIKADDLLISEFVDIRQSGLDLFHKYGAFFINGKVIPRHLFFSQKWMVKVDKNPGPPALQMERSYIESNSMSREIGAIFKLANIDYGRIDFGIKNNRIIVFEINTNPIVLDSSDLNFEPRIYLTKLFFSQIVTELKKIGYISY